MEAKQRAVVMPVFAVTAAACPVGVFVGRHGSEKYAQRKMKKLSVPFLPLLSFCFALSLPSPTFFHFVLRPSVRTKVRIPGCRVWREMFDALSVR